MFFHVYLHEKQPLKEVNPKVRNSLHTSTFPSPLLPSHSPLPPLTSSLPSPPPLFTFSPSTLPSSPNILLIPL